MNFKRLHLGHGTAVAYLSLFLTLGGTGFAATRIAGVGAPVAHGAGAAKVKVRCTAKQGAKKVKCQVVGGSGSGSIGPRGPRGFPGTNGTNGTNGTGGAAGPTVLTQPPAFSVAPGGAIAFQGAGGSFSANDEEQGWTATSFSPSANTGSQTSFVTYLLSPSKVAGSAEHLASVEFCYGAFANTNAAYPEKAAISITHATVDEYTESATAGTTPVGAPPYSAVPLIDTALTVPAGYGCQTLTPPTPPEIDPSGYLELSVTASFSSGGYYQNGSNYQYPVAPMYLGSVTTTYSP
jgi:hypothetical protein